MRFVIFSPVVFYWLRLFAVWTVWINVLNLFSQKVEILDSQLVTTVFLVKIETNELRFCKLLRCFRFIIFFQ